MDQHRLEERRRNVAIQQPIPILREGRRRPHRVIHLQVNEPAEQGFVLQLLHQLSLTPNGVERLQQRACCCSLFGGTEGRPKCTYRASSLADRRSSARSVIRRTARRG